jgi:hypothetical protein
MALRSGTLAAAQVILALLVLWIVPSPHVSNFLAESRISANIREHPNSAGRLLAGQLLLRDRIIGMILRYPSPMFSD